MLFPCRTPEETCYVGVVKDGKVTVLFTNDRKADEIAGKPMAVSGEGLDLAKTENRTVMLVGSYDPKDGLTKAEVVDVASPLVAFALKSTIGGGEPDERRRRAPAPPPPAQEVTGAPRSYPPPLRGGGHGVGRRGTTRRKD